MRLPPYPNPSRFTNRFRAIFIKQLILCKRNPNFFLLSLLLPLLIIISFCHSVGRTHSLNGISIGFFNNDTQDKNFTWDDCSFVAGCSDKMLKCRFLDTLRRKDDFRFVEFVSEVEALEGVENGEISALVKFENGFDVEIYNYANQEIDDDKNSKEHSANLTKFQFYYYAGNSKFFVLYTCFVNLCIPNLFCISLKAYF